MSAHYPLHVTVSLLSTRSSSLGLGRETRKEARVKEVRVVGVHVPPLIPKLN